MFETENLTDEIIKQRRKDKSRNRKKTIKRHCCSLCGEPKRYICLDHHPRPRKGLRRIWGRIKYYSRKTYFNLLRNLKFVD